MADVIGIVGTGRMGTAIGKRLIQTGHAVMAWNRTPERANALAEAGATRAGSPAEVAAACGTIITSLTDQAALDAVFGGERGLLSGDMTAKVFVEMSTILPDGQESLARAARAAGAGYVACPVGGTVGPALKGELLGLAGGTEADFATVRPVLETLCKRVEFVGDVGAAAAMKLAVNLPLAVYWATLGEAVSLLPEQAFDSGRVASILADSSGGPNALRNRLEVVARTLGGEDQKGTFDLDGLQKDLRLALEWAARGGKAMPVTRAASETYAAAIAAGLGGFDGSTVARFVRAGGLARS